jgi:hypothetical protein
LEFSRQALGVFTLSTWRYHAKHLACFFQVLGAGVEQGRKSRCVDLQRSQNYIVFAHSLHKSAKNAVIFVVILLKMLTFAQNYRI